VLSEIADVTYKCSTYYDGAIERGFHYADPDVGIAWPDDVELLVSERDRTAPPLSAIAGELPF
jgi:dTDP-4-dehydrorhamnose 3,5-epimerase